MVTLIFYKNSRWHLCDKKVKYIQHGEEITQYIRAEGRDWWTDFETKWEHTEIIEFMPVEPTEVQLERFNEILELNIGEGFSSELSKYVEFGTFPDGINHALRPLQILKRQEEQDEYLIDLDFRQSLSEMGVDL